VCGLSPQHAHFLCIKQLVVALLSFTVHKTGTRQCTSELVIICDYCFAIDRWNNNRRNHGEHM